MRHVELSRTATVCAPSFDKPSIPIKLDDLLMELAGLMAIRDENFAVGRNQHGTGHIQRNRPAAGVAGLPKRAQDLPVLIKFENIIALVAGRLGVRHPDMAGLVDEDSVRKDEHPCPKPTQEVSLG